MSDYNIIGQKTVIMYDNNINTLEDNNITTISNKDCLEKSVFNLLFYIENIIFI